MARVCLVHVLMARQVGPDSLGRLRANAIDHFESAAFSEPSQVIQRSDLELLMEHRCRLWPNARKFQQVQNRRGRLSRQTLPRLEGVSFNQLDDLAGQR